MYFRRGADSVRPEPVLCSSRVVFRKDSERVSSAYRMVQPPLWSLLVLTCRATRAASVKASLTPRFFMAEHSRHVSWLSLISKLTRLTQVPQSLDLLCYAKTLIIVDTWLLGLLVIRVVIFFFPQVTLECNQNELNARAVLCYLADPFRFYVLERVR